ncbi:MAG: transposase [Candidatus Peregrinibacteria bacterium]
MNQRHFIQNNSTMLVTTNTLDRRPIFAKPAIAKEAIDCLYRTQQFHPFFLYAFVIMPDHCHLLMRVPEPATISRVMNAFKSGLTFDTGIGKMWQQRFYISLADDPAEAKHYIHMNPVKAGLVENPQDYPWSSACGRWDISPLELDLSVDVSIQRYS